MTTERSEQQTEPGWFAPVAKPKRPWWAVALAGGFGAILAVLFALGLIGTQAQAREPHQPEGPRIATSAFAAGQDNARLDAIEAALKDLSEARKQDAAKLDRVAEGLARIEGRLDRSR